MKALTSNQLAYIAGLFDGEGTLVIGKYPIRSQKNLAYRGFMALANTHVPTLLHIKSLIGGRIVEQGIGKKCYSLTLSANEIRAVLPELLPYLMIKKEQAEVMLRFFERQASRNFGLLSQADLEFYEFCYKKVKSLKKDRFSFKESFKILGKRKCAVCEIFFEVTSKNSSKTYCSRYHLEKARWTRYNKLVSERKKSQRLSIVPQEN